ncbi:MAG: type II secretion system F family protein [Oenococcus sp.]|uniref:type II secretion system F family protein n=1 Tax=Oenococcus TaxID=46254 RepID=UPI0021E6DFF3|nr:type II secretion system F family protein [Oenococcus kitaharae]MCV3296073.1 type II secretion system F family protein [Oenococcus kitaharae]
MMHIVIPGFQKKSMKPISRLPRKRQVAFFSLFGQLIQSGYSINHAVQFMQQTSPDEIWIQKLASSLEQGQNFANAIAPYLSASLNFQISMANKYGHLEDVLLQLADFSSKQLDQENKIKQVLRYPIILVCLLAVMALVVKIFLLPILSSWQTDQSDSTSQNGLLYFELGGILMACLFLAFYYCRRFKNKPRLKRLESLVKIPIFGKTLAFLINYEFSIQLSMLLSSGLQLAQVAEEVALSQDDSLEADFAKKMVETFTSGSNLSGYFQKLPFLDRTIAVYFQQGSDSELLNKNLKTYSQITYRKFLASVDKIIALIQPLSFAVVGIGIVFLYLSMLMPMYQTLGGMNQ